jgi:hypothetical protein
MCFPALPAITSIQRVISEFVVSFQIPNLKWEQPFGVASMYGKTKSILVRDDQMVTVPFTRMCRKSVAWCGMKLVAS